MNCFLYLLVLFPLISSLEECTSQNSVLNSPSKINDDLIHIVVASLGRPNLDDEPEDLTWIPSSLDSQKVLFLYDRTNTNSMYYINTTKGNECLTYLTYILDHYDSLPSAVIFIHADASRHCPFISNILQKSNDDILSTLSHELNLLPGYFSLSKIFLNQSYSYIKGFNLGLLELSNEILSIKCQYEKELHLSSHDPSTLPSCSIPPSSDFPEFTTTYTSGSFIVSREKILQIPKEYYIKLYNKLYHGEQWSDTTCGALEYVWTTIWGGKPWAIQPNNFNQWCGPLYYADISSNYGFMFYQSDDGSVENEGYLPERYHGVIYDRDTHVVSVGRFRYTEEDEEEEGKEREME